MMQNRKKKKILCITLKFLNTNGTLDFILNVILTNLSLYHFFGSKLKPKMMLQVFSYFP